MAVGNTLAYVAPQLAGAIDIVVVHQPDGSLKSSPFYGAHLPATCIRESQCLDDSNIICTVFVAQRFR